MKKLNLASQFIHSLLYKLLKNALQAGNISMWRSGTMATLPEKSCSRSWLLICRLQEAHICYLTLLVSVTPKRSCWLSEIISYSSKYLFCCLVHLLQCFHTLIYIVRNTHFNKCTELVLQHLSPSLIAVVLEVSYYSGYFQTLVGWYSTLALVTSFMQHIQIISCPHWKLTVPIVLHKTLVIHIYCWYCFASPTLAHSHC